MNSWMSKEKLLDFIAPVNGSPIPQQHHRSPEMLEQLFKEGADIQTRKITRPKSEIESQMLPLRGHRQSTDGRNPVLFVNVIEDRGLSFWSPGAAYVGNKQEAGLIEEDQMGPKSFGVFLYGATDTVSNGRPLSRSFVKPDAPVFGNSIPSPEAGARHDWDDTESQSVSGRSGRSASTSKGLSGIPRPGDLLEATPLTSPSRLAEVWEDAQESPSNEGPWSPLSGMPDTSERQSFLMRPPNVLQPKGSPCPLSAGRWHVDGASPVPLGIHGVSYPTL